MNSTLFQSPQKLLLLSLFCIFFVACFYKPLSKEKKAEMKVVHESAIPFFKEVARRMYFKENDTLCDIAGGWGYSSSIISQYLPASTIYFEEDIGVFCNRKAFRNTFKFYDMPFNFHQFNFKIGKKDHIPFPNNRFNNVSVFISIHEFDYKQEMLDEVNRIMRKDGKLTIVETVYKDTIVKDKNCGFNYISEKELYELLNHYNYKYLVDTSISEILPLGNSFSKIIILQKKN